MVSRRKLATVVLAISTIGLVGVWVAWQELSPARPIAPAALADPGQASQARTGDATKIVGPVLSRSKPVRLEIPSIGVDSSVQNVGQQDNGSLEVPVPGPHYNDAAWYRYSPTPGSLGPAILLGHVDSATEGPSVFFRLGEVERKDRVEVTRADGSTAIFVVDEVRRFAKKDFPTKLVYGNLNHSGLRILTCGGAFDEVSGHYLDNIVVFASLVGSRPA